MKVGLVDTLRGMEEVLLAVGDVSDGGGSAQSEEVARLAYLFFSARTNKKVVSKPPHNLMRTLAQKNIVIKQQKMTSQKVTKHGMEINGFLIAKHKL
jgi:hypothetical protein